MATKLFITGTDTEVGKTMASCALLAAANQQGKSTLGLKPVAAGCETIDGQLQNEDAIALMEHSSINLPYEQVNPVALKTPCSPHIAASIDGRNVSCSRLVGVCNGALLSKPDFLLVEGAGGWRVPLSPRETIADLARQLDYPVVLVVALKLGCLNHALLSAEAIKRDGLKLAGWIGNRVQTESMSYEAENISTLESAIDAPCFGILPYSSSGAATELANSLDLTVLDL